MADAKITELTELTSVTNSDLIAVVDDPSGNPITKKATVGNVMSASGLVLTLPQINDTTADNQYVFGVSELTADRTVTLPLLTGDDEFVFKDFSQTLTNKTLTAPKLADGGFIADANGNEVIKATTTASAVNEITVTPSATGNAVGISATGGDTNIDLKLTAKGTGGIQDKNGDYIGPNSSMSRQALINGNFDVNQRGVSLTLVDTSVQYLFDRWHDILDKSGGTPPTLTRTRELLTSGDIYNSFAYSRLTTNGAGTNLGNDSYHFYRNKIEYGTRFLCGNDKKVTLSFYARSSIANKRLGIALQQSYGTGGSPASIETINGTNFTLTSSWTKYTYTFTTNTLVGKTFGTANDDYLSFLFGIQWGSTYQLRFGASTTESYVGSGTIDIAQVQLCAGDVALPFMPKSFEEELRACQRYYYQLNNFSEALIIPGMATSTTTTRSTISTPVTLRANPVISYSTISSDNFYLTGNVSANVTELSMVHYAGNIITIQASVASGLTSGNMYYLALKAAGAYIGLSAEL